MINYWLNKISQKTIKKKKSMMPYNDVMARIFYRSCIFSISIFVDSFSKQTTWQKNFYLFQISISWIKKNLMSIKVNNIIWSFLTISSRLLHRTIVMKLEICLSFIFLFVNQSVTFYLFDLIKFRPIVIFFFIGMYKNWSSHHVSIKFFFRNHHFIFEQW